MDRLRLISDRDKFPRRLPLKEGAIELPMETVYDVENYWKECRRSIGLHRGRWTLKKPDVRPQGPGIALVNIEVSTPKLPQFYSLIALGGFVFLVAAMITIIVTLDKVDDWFAVFPLLILLFLVVMLVVIGWRRKHQIQKVVVYNGTEWRLLSGEWQAPEDRNLRWLRQR